jgi:hypothetical protein
MNRASLPGMLLFAGLALAPPAFSGTVFSQSGTATNDFVIGSNVEQIFEAGWSTLGSFSNVSISAEVSDFGDPASVITAYLTTAIGPTETTEDQIATFTFSPATNDEVDTLFSGLNLGPGSYYLVLASGSTAISGWWGARSPTTTTGSGVTFNGDGFANNVDSGSPDPANPPASTFVFDLGLLVDVTGDPVTVPEPASLALMLPAAIAAICLGKRLSSR